MSGDNLCPTQHLLFTQTTEVTAARELTLNSIGRRACVTMAGIDDCYFAKCVYED